MVELVDTPGGSGWLVPVQVQILLSLRMHQVRRRLGSCVLSCAINAGQHRLPQAL